ncbi:MAG: PA14 domain-containing protein, partial [Chthoniobacteraceae bacterium]
DVTLDFSTGTWGARAPVGITGGSDADWENFSVQWDGYVRVTQAGDRFATVSDDGSRMWIDVNGNGVFDTDELLDNGWGGVQGATIRDRSRRLPIGTYRIRIQYYEISGGNEFHLVSSPFVPRAFTAGANNAVQVVKVLVLNFEPRIPSRQNRKLWEVYGWMDPRRLAAQFEADIEFATGGAIDVQIVEMRNFDEFPKFSDGFRYNPDQYVLNRDSNTNWHTGNADYYFLMERENLPALVNSNQVDEVWCFGDHYFALFGEAYMGGPNSFFINGPSFPNIGFDRAVAGYGFNYERGVAEMVHDLCHRTENHGQRAFGNWNLTTPVTAFDKFSANFRDSPGQTAGIGSCHVPANGDTDYDYGNVRVVQSTAFDWANYPATTGATTAVSRATWGMGSAPDYQRDYLSFYFGMMPRNTGTAADGRQANWFKYIWDFNSYEPTTGAARQEDAFGSGPTIRNSGGTTADFTVRYYDVTGINPTTLDSSDIQVTGPGGFSQIATLVNTGTQLPTTTGTARTVTYRVTAPGGTWDAGDSGTYHINVRTTQVRDTLGNNVPAGDIGTFQVLIDNPAVLNVAQLLASGQASVANTTIDIGPIGNLFDGSVDTLIRTPNIDPAVVTLTFTTAKTIHGFRAYFTGASGSPAYQWQIETANTQADLDAHTGSWQQAVALTGTTSDAYSSVTLATPITAKLARLTATRLTGDDYVHICEWQLVGPPVNDAAPPTAAGTSANVSTAGGTAQFITVTYTDATGVNVATLTGSDLLITGPNGFNTTATFYDVDSFVTGTSRIATYWFIPPGGNWDATDSGTYSFALQANEVRDIVGNAAAAQTLGSFTVNIAPPVRRPSYDLAESNAAQWLSGADSGTASTSLDSARKVLGANAIHFTTNGGFDTWLRFPPADGADWDLTAANNLYFSVYAVNTNSPQFQNNSPWIRLNDIAGGYFEYRYYQSGAQSDPLNTALNQWRAFTVPLRAADTVTNGWRRTIVGSPRLDHIGSVEFHADTWGAGFDLWYDRVGFDLPVSVTTATFDANAPHRLLVDFDQSVAATLATSDLQLQTVPGGVVIPAASLALSYDSLLDVATVTFPGQPGAMLAGGQYRLTISAAAVADPAGNTLAANYVFDFTVPADFDGDGLLDTWERLYWPVTTGHSAADDFDHDGLSELQELAFGLNPTLSDAKLQPAVVTENGYLTITIAKHPGVTYQVQSAGTLFSAQPSSFSAATTTVLTNNATTLKVRDNVLVGTPPGRFLRVVVTAAP